MISLTASIKPRLPGFWIALFLLTLFLRVASLYTPFWDVDEAQFAGFAHVLLDGGLPFRDSLDTKSLGIYLYYAACFALFGKFNMLAVHAVSILWMFLVSVSLYGLFRVAGREAEGRLAAVLFTVFSAAYVPKITATSINSVMVLFLVLSVLCILVAERRKNIMWDALAGLVLGVAFLFKYQAGIQMVVFCLFTLPIWEFRKSSQNFVYPSWSGWFWRNLLFGIAFVLPFVIQSLVLFKLGVWRDFYEWSVLGSGRYISAGRETVSFGWSVLTRFVPYLLATLPLWYGAFLAFRRRLWLAGEGFSFLLVLLVLFSLVPVCLGGRFYPHYFLQLLPWLSGLAACSLYDPLVSRARVRGAVLLFCVLITSVFWLLRADYEWYLKRFGDDDLYLERRVGERIRDLSSPGESIFVWGFANVIHFYSERSSSSRFLWSDWLTGRVPGPNQGRVKAGISINSVSDIAWQVLFEDFQKNPPAIFVDTATAAIHGYENFPLSDYPDLYRYVLGNFQKKKVIEGVTVYLRVTDP